MKRRDITAAIKQYLYNGWEWISKQMDTVIDSFVKRSQEILKDNLVGIYLHGSAVMGCYNPDKSDLDMIVVVKESMTEAVKRSFMDMVVELNSKGPSKGIEMSIVKKSVCKPFVYPTPFELHFSVATTIVAVIWCVWHFPIWLQPTSNHYVDS